MSGPFGDREAHVGEDRGQFVDHLADRMDAARFGRRLAHRQRDVDGLGVEAGVERRVLERVPARRERLGDTILEAVDARPFGLALRRASCVPSVRSSAETEPLLPSAAIRTASSAASSPAAEMAARISCSS